MRSSRTTRLIASLKSIYDDAESHYDLYLLLEDFIEFDELRFLLWRGRHVRMVERMIGLVSPAPADRSASATSKRPYRKNSFRSCGEVRTHLGTGRAYGVLSEAARAPAELKRALEREAPLAADAPGRFRAGAATRSNRFRMLAVGEGRAFRRTLDQQLLREKLVVPRASRW